jgi:shikimate dehydrogenase
MVDAHLVKLVALIGSPVAHSLSPRMQNAAFAARGLDWTYVACEVSDVGAALKGLEALGFVGANVTAPHKLEASQVLGAEVPSVNTVLFDPTRGVSTDAAILDGLEYKRPAIVGDGGGATAFREALPGAQVFSRRGEWPPQVKDCDLVVNATPVKDEVLVRLGTGQTLVDLPYPDSATAVAAREHGARVLGGLEVLVAQGAASFELWTRIPAPVEVMRRAVGLPRAEADDSR